MTVSPQDPSDEELLRRFDDGDADAFETLVRRYERPLYNFILRSVRRRERARFGARWGFNMHLHAEPSGYSPRRTHRMGASTDALSNTAFFARQASRSLFSLTARRYCPLCFLSTPWVLDSFATRQHTSRSGSSTLHRTTRTCPSLLASHVRATRSAGFKETLSPFSIALSDD